ncbi:MAG: amidohydrolase family protein [Rhodospirillaceae bacterium]|nr:amidohydrolase family protein [Rhodospirillaceae bacterium]
MIVDWHVHWLPPALADALRARTHPPRIVADPNGGPGGERLDVHREVLPVTPALIDAGARLDFMDRHSVSRQVLSLPGLFGIDSLPAADAAPLVRLFNDALAALIADRPARFSGLAALPLADPAAAAEELARAMDTPGFAGAILPADAFLTRREAEAWAPLLDAANAHGAHIFIHPGPVPAVGAQPPPDYGDNVNLRHIVLDVQARLSAVTVTLTLTDFLDAFPDLTVQVANLGGSVPMMVERMDHVSSRRTPDAPLPSARMGRIFVDTSSFGPGSIALAARTFGADRVLLGTDHPIFDTQRTVAAIRASGLPDDAVAGILGGNGPDLPDR